MARGSEPVSARSVGRREIATMLVDLLSEFLGSLLGGGTPKFYGLLCFAAAAVTVMVVYLRSIPFTFEVACYVGGAVVAGVALLVWHWITEPVRKHAR
jgi:hypothetical protein